jgi:hypothetical protein
MLPSTVSVKIGLIVSETELVGFDAATLFPMAARAARRLPSCARTRAAPAVDSADVVEAAGQATWGHHLEWVRQSRLRLAPSEW